LCQPREADVDGERQQAAQRKHDQGNLNEHVKASEPRSQHASVP
jgi:hypothetical protein